ncbi:hypothetical protein CMK17_17185 [Candidatus Poribacteria bacterium]|jgi:ABC-type uncharacterized transport system permease subunit|uniref:MotA/TolQ/ExbB proton channel domain-containing protein n=1 Tax=marine metagenome TaxID=408172 RepID=A0A382QDG6_9ZZZZ|nr:hypothetical protein [Candidatus Poribacteria bacterium]MBT21667.1 hypothetical protein [Candidatus Poribacteria bacterium]MCS5609365.1 hypothetical protein [Candidatus Poribacteria bacterium]|tara:strand:+ start:500 stop:754 length:255 start_codon:yes stop_codon:yes gene_type:complete
MKKIGYLLLITAVASMLLATLIGLTVGLLEIPFGDSTALESILITLWIVGTLLVFLGLSFLLVKVIKERIQNKEDNYYAQKVDK